MCCSGTVFPKCPYCGFEDQDWWDGLGEKFDGDTWNVECLCGLTYKVTLCVTAYFDSEKKVEEPR